MSRIISDKVDNLQTATIDWHRRKMFRAIFYQSEFRTGRFGEPGPGVILNSEGILVVNASGNTVGLFDLNGGLWLPKSGILTQVQTFDDGGGHQVLYL